MKLSKLIQNYKDQLPGGAGDKTNPDDVDKKQLAIGVLVEMEHTNDPIKAMEISLDHLQEHSFYYSILIKSSLVDEEKAIKLYKKLYNK